MKADRPKQYLQLGNKTVLEHTVQCFSDHHVIKQIVVAISVNDQYWDTLELQSRYGVLKAKGGEERCHSVLNALGMLSSDASDDDWILVHDAARPCMRREDLDQLVDKVTAGSDGGILAFPVRDTMKRSNDDNVVQETVDRNNLWHALTPQMFRYAQLKKALQQALQDGFLVTDEASAMEHVGFSPLLVEGHPDNIKITHPDDLEVAAFYLSQQGRI